MQPGGKFVGYAFSVAFFVGIYSAGIYSASAETLREVVREVLQDNPEVASLALNRAAIEQEERQAKGLKRPNLELFAGAGIGRDDRNFIRDGSSFQGDVGVALTQKLFDGFESKNRVLRQKARGASARSRVKDASNIVALQVVRAFLETRRAHAIAALARQNVSRHKRIVGQVRQSANAGRGTNTQVQQALAQLEQSRIDLESAELLILDAKTAFHAVVGRAPGKLQRVKTPTVHFPHSSEDAVALALAQSPAVQARVFDADAALSAVKVANADRYPKINLEASVFQTFNEIPGVSDTDYDGQALVRLRYKLYGGGINRSRRREAEIRAAEARNDVEITKRTIARDVRLAYGQTTSAKKRVSLMRSKANRSSKILPDYVAQFDAGRRSLLDVLDIQNDIYVNRSAAVSEEFTAKFNRFRILALSGKLVQALGVQLPTAATHKFHMTVEDVDAWENLR